MALSVGRVIRRDRQRGRLRRDRGRIRRGGSPDVGGVGDGDFGGVGGVGGVEGGGDVEIVTVAVAACGFSSLAITNVPVTGAVPPLGNPSQVAVRVRDCPGCNVSARTKRGFAPEFDRQTSVPSWVAMKPSTLGP